MNAFGTDASALGNHEFDLGSPVLQGAIQNSGAWVGAQFPLITANLNFAADSSLRGLADKTLNNNFNANDFAGQEASTIKCKIAPYAVVTQGGEKIGLVGATTYDLLTKTSPNGTAPKDDGNDATDDLQEVAAYIQAAVNSLNALGVNKIVMVDQLDTIDRNKLLAPQVSGIDVMIAGGGHERMGDATDTAVGFNGHTADFISDAYPIVTAGADGKPTLIVTTDTEYTYLGRLVADFDANGELIVSNLDPAINGAYAATESTLQAAYGTTDSASQIVAASTIGAKVNAITQAINNVIFTKDGTLWGYTNVYLEGDRAFGRVQEVNLGDISADANLRAAQQALGVGFITSLKNGGGLRAAIGSIGEDGGKIPPIANPFVGKPAGAISTLDIENALRFDNKLMIFETTPQGLKNILEYAAGLSSGPTVQNGGYMQIGGMRVSYNYSSGAPNRVKSIALTDLNGNVNAAVYGNGAFYPGAPATIRMVSLNFTANGGDGYPIKANADNFRYLLTDGTLSGPVNETLDFTAAATFATVGQTAGTILGEQKAFQNYLTAFHSTPATAFNMADTPIELDQRIQILPIKAADTVIPPPSVNAGGPYSVNEGGSVTLNATGSDPNGDSLTYEWDLDNDDTFETPGQSVAFSAALLDGPNSYTVKVRGTDPGGLSAVATGTVDVVNVAPIVNAPTVTPEPSTEGQSVIASATFTDPGVADAPFTCAVDYGDGSGPLAGVAAGNTCAGPAHTYPTFGTYAVVVSITDKDSGAGSNATTHTVIFNWSGFFPPVDNLPALNSVKAGSAIPVKFGLGGNKGLNIFAAGYPQSERIACNTGTLLGDPKPTANPGASSLSFGGGKYNYVWKTEKGWAGQCRQLVVRLIDGTEHRVNFQFK